MQAAKLNPCFTLQASHGLWGQIIKGDRLCSGLRTFATESGHLDPEPIFLLAKFVFIEFLFQ
jgi:hypothetical protein